MDATSDTGRATIMNAARFSKTSLDLSNQVRALGTASNELHALWDSERDFNPDLAAVYGRAADLVASAIDVLHNAFKDSREDDAKLERLSRNQPQPVTVTP